MPAHEVPAGNRLRVDILTDIVQIEERLDSVITFALIRFVHQIGRGILSEEELALGTGAGLVLLSTLPATSHMQYMFTLSRKIFVMVFSQCAINLVAPRQPTGDNVQATAMLQAFTITTCMLLLMSLLAYAFRDIDAVRRSMTLLLYIYADSTEYIVKTLDLGGLLAALVAVLVYVVFQIYAAKLRANFTLLYILRAFNMVCINLVLQSLVDVEKTYVSVDFQGAILIIVLLLIDSFSAVLPALAESRDYAIWKGSQALYILLTGLAIESDVMLFVCFAILCSKPMWKSMLTSVYELTLLVIINVILDIASAYITRAHTFDKAVLLFIYVVFIHEASGLVFAEPRK